MPEPAPITITCNSCQASVQTFNGSDPHGALECPCCPEDHTHTGLEPCPTRTITISATAYLSGEATQG